jgi:serine phosphatase RsbU (regulator of sigma subunit)
MILRRYQNSLKARLNLAVAAVYLVAALGSLAVFAVAAKAILADFAQRIAVKQALLERNRIYSAIEREVTLARTLAHDPVIRRWVQDEGDQTAKREAFEQLDNYQSLFRDKSCFVAVDASKRYYILTGLEGAGRMQTMLLDPGRPSDHWYFHTMDTVEDFALNLDYNTAINAAKVWFNVVIRDASGRKIGVGGGGVDITAFIRDIVTPTDKDISAIVVDAAGIIQAHADRAIMEHNASAVDDARKITVYSLTKDPASAARLKQALAELGAGREGVEAFPVVLAGTRALAAVAAIPEIGWFNVVLVDVSRVVGDRVFWPLFVLIMACLLLVIVTITYVLGKMVVAPLVGLTAASKEMAAGRYGIRLPVTRGDEIGQLTASFNLMTEQVRDHTENLESKVRARTAELTAAYEKLDESRQRSMESLRYARSIQRAVLPGREALDAVFAEHMELYRPRDLVGGDLYFFREFPGHILYGVLDCTGHGVPGAFMAMTVHAVLSHVTSVIRHDDPAVILRETDRVLRETLGLAAGENVLDCGLEIALCCYNRATGALVFAGAGLSLFILGPDGLGEIKGDRQRLGFRQAFAGRDYTNHEVADVRGKRFYATTDGILDEAGGEKGYGFGEKRFGEMLLAHAGLPLAKQAARVEETLAAYRGERKQRDDVTLIGFAFKTP